jgi:hypothetical protein
MWACEGSNTMTTGIWQEMWAERGQRHPEALPSPGPEGGFHLTLPLDVQLFCTKVFSAEIISVQLSGEDNVAS